MLDGSLTHAGVFHNPLHVSQERAARVVGAQLEQLLHAVPLRRHDDGPKRRDDGDGSEPKCGNQLTKDRLVVCEVDRENDRGSVLESISE